MYVRLVVEEWVPAAWGKPPGSADARQWITSVDGVWLQRVTQVVMPGVKRGQAEVKDVLKMLHWGIDH
jgi:hypothetical protein